jgi:hypothetical protein
MEYVVICSVDWIKYQYTYINKSLISLMSVGVACAEPCSSERHDKLAEQSKKSAERAGYGKKFWNVLYPVNVLITYIRSLTFQNDYQAAEAETWRRMNEEEKRRREEEEKRLKEEEEMKEREEEEQRKKEEEERRRSEHAERRRRKDEERKVPQAQSDTCLFVSTLVCVCVHT